MPERLGLNILLRMQIVEFTLSNIVIKTDYWYSCEQIKEERLTMILVAI